MTRRYCAVAAAAGAGFGESRVVGRRVRRRFGLAGGVGGVCSDATLHALLAVRSGSIAARRQRRSGGRRLVGRAGSRRAQRRGLLAAAADVQPVLDALRPAGNPAEDAARRLARGRGERDGRRGRALPSSAAEASTAGGAALATRRLAASAAAILTAAGAGLRIAEDDLLRASRERVRVALVLVAGEDRILPAVGIDEADRLDARGDQIGDLGVVLLLLLRDQRLDVFVARERRAGLTRGDVALRASRRTRSACRRPSPTVRPW